MEKSKQKEALEKLLEKAKSDPKFLHGLVFNAEAEISKLDFLTRDQKANLVSITPEAIIAGIAGTHKINLSAVCGHSCEDSCDDTCGAGSCLGTCMSSSCDHTCGARSCDVTVEIVGFRPEIDYRDRFENNFGNRRFSARRRF